MDEPWTGFGVSSYDSMLAFTESEATAYAPGEWSAGYYGRIRLGVFVLFLPMGDWILGTVAVALCGTEWAVCIKRMIGMTQWSWRCILEPWVCMRRFV